MTMMMMMMYVTAFKVDRCPRFSFLRQKPRQLVVGFTTSPGPLGPMPTHPKKHLPRVFLLWLPTRGILLAYLIRGKKWVHAVHTDKHFWNSLRFYTIFNSFFTLIVEFLFFGVLNNYINYIQSWV